METITLYRPVGPKELALIQASAWREFPPRLPGQPIFYPVLNEEYATQIARDWNAKRDGGGYVTRFRVRAEYAAGTSRRRSVLQCTRSFGSRRKSCRNSTETSLEKSKSSRSFMRLREPMRPANFWMNPT